VRKNTKLAQSHLFSGAFLFSEKKHKHTVLFLVGQGLVATLSIPSISRADAISQRLNTKAMKFTISFTPSTSRENRSRVSESTRPRVSDFARHSRRPFTRRRSDRPGGPDPTPPRKPKKGPQPFNASPLFSGPRRETAVPVPGRDPAAVSPGGPRRTGRRRLGTPRRLHPPLPGLPDRISRAILKTNVFLCLWSRRNTFRRKEF